MSESTVGEEPTIGDRPGVRGNWVLIGLFSVLSLAGIALASGSIDSGFVDVPAQQPEGIVVPLFVYLYATFGALGYVFTRLMMDIRAYDERDELADLIGMGMRVPAAWVLATGFYLVVVQSGTANAVDNPYVIATVAFLVGLYVNVAIKSLGSLADRMLGRGKPAGAKRQDGGGSSRSEQDGSSRDATGTRTD